MYLYDVVNVFYCQYTYTHIHTYIHTYIHTFKILTCILIYIIGWVGVSSKLIRSNPLLKTRNVDH